MPNFSKDPLLLLEDHVAKSNLANPYVGARLMQGVPLLDRDLNLRTDLLAAAVRNVFSRYLGDGAPADAVGSFKIAALAPLGNGFSFTLGKLLAGGVEVEAKLSYTYAAQPLAPGETLPALTANNTAQVRVDLVYLDVWLAHVDSAEEPGLFNPDDFEIETAVRLAPRFRVRVAEGGAVPPAQFGHVHYLLARITRPANTATVTEQMLSDQRMTHLGLAPLVGRVTVDEADDSLLKKLLTPAFAPAPYSHEYAYSGLCVTIRGRHFSFGDVAVELRAAGASANAPWTAAEVVEMPSPGAVSFRVPAELTGKVQIAVTNGVGKAVVPAPLYVFGPPKFDSRTLSVNNAPMLPKVAYQLSPPAVYPNKTVTLRGSFFDMPEVEVHVRKEGTSTWIPVTIVPGSMTATQIQIKAPTSTSGNHKVRVRTPASPIAAESTELLYIHP